MSRTKPNPASLPEPAFSQDDVLASLRALMELRAGQEGMTRDEIIDGLGVSRSKAGALLKRAFKAGKLISGRGLRMAIDGTMRAVPVYTLRG
jgi:DNA-binding CsgD family transcriptional regulator